MLVELRSLMLKKNVAAAGVMEYYQTLIYPWWFAVWFCSCLARVWTFHWVKLITIMHIALSNVPQLHGWSSNFISHDRDYLTISEFLHNIAKRHDSGTRHA